MEMVGTFYAAHLMTTIDAAALNVRRAPPAAAVADPRVTAGTLIQARALGRPDQRQPSAGATCVRMLSSAWAL